MAVSTRDGEKGTSLTDGNGRKLKQVDHPEVLRAEGLEGEPN